MIICEQGELVIGRHSVVGANSVITRSIPPYSVVSGDPARIVKQYDFSQGKWVLGCIRPADWREPGAPGVRGRRPFLKRDTSISFKLYGSNHTFHEMERHDEQFAGREQRGSSRGICPFG